MNFIAVDVASTLENSPIPLDYSLPLEHRNLDIDGWENDFVLIPMEVGDLSAHIYMINLAEDVSGTLRYMRVKEGRKIKAGNPLNHELGVRQYEWEESGHAVFLRTRPTTSYLNGAMQRIYNTTHNNPPMTFTSHHVSKRGFIKGKEFIELLAEGKVFLASPDQGFTRAYAHDTEAHVEGYCRMSPKVFEAIRLRAMQLVERGIKTAVDGKLTDPDDIDFADAVDTLSNLSYRANRSQRSQYDIFLKRLLVISKNQEAPILQIVKAAMLYRSLMRHQYWLEKRAKTLQAKQK